MKTPWDEIYKKKGRLYLEPHEDLKKLVEIFKKEGVERILDLGCGNGRHLVFLAKSNFEVYGIDNSKKAIEIAKEWLKEENLRAKLKIGDIFEKFPFKASFFDAIISVRVIHHQRIGKIKKLIKEIERVLKRRGFFFGTVLAREKIPKERLKKIKFVDKRTYLILEGEEKGLYHFHFNKKILRETLKNFKILKIWRDSENYLAFLAKLK